MKLWILNVIRDGDLQGPRAFTFVRDIAVAWSEATGGLPFDPARVRDAVHGADRQVYVDRLEMPGRVAIPDEMVEEIRERYNRPGHPSTTQLAREMGIGQTTVSALLRGTRRGDSGK
jgi:hypothetical protein